MRWLNKWISFALQHALAWLWFIHITFNCLLILLGGFSRIKWEIRILTFFIFYTLLFYNLYNKFISERIGTYRYVFFLLQKMTTHHNYIFMLANRSLLFFYLIITYILLQLLIEIVLIFNINWFSLNCNALVILIIFILQLF